MSFTYTISIGCPEKVGPEVVSRVDRREGHLVVADFYVELLGMRIIRVGCLKFAKRVDALHNFAFSGDGWSDCRPPRWPDPDYPAQIHFDFQARDLDVVEARVLELGGSKLGQYPDHRVFADPVGHPFCLYPADTNDDDPCSGELCSTAPPQEALARFYEHLVDEWERIDDTRERVVIGPSNPPRRRLGTVTSAPGRRSGEQYRPCRDAPHSRRGGRLAPSGTRSVRSRHTDSVDRARRWHQLERVVRHRRTILPCSTRQCGGFSVQHRRRVWFPGPNSLLDTYRRLGSACAVLTDRCCNDKLGGMRADELSTGATSPEAAQVAKVVRSTWNIDTELVGEPKLGPRRSTFHLRGGLWLAVAGGGEATILRREARLLSELNGAINSVAFPLIVPTADGELWHEGGQGRAWRICTTVPGQNARDTDEITWASLAEGIAALSVGLADVSPAMAVREGGIVAVTHQLLADLRRGGRNAFPAGRESVERAAAFLHPHIERLLALPTQLTHGDCHLPNLFVAGTGQLQAVIDVEFAAVDPAIVDVAALLASLVIDSGLDDLPRRANELFVAWARSGGTGSFDDLLASFVCGRLALYAHHRDRLTATHAAELTHVLRICAEYVDVAVRFAEAALGPNRDES